MKNKLTGKRGRKEQNMKSTFYAVKKGYSPGIYLTWEEAKKQIHGFSGAVYKKFSSEDEAKLFIKKSYSKETNKNTDCQLFVDGSYSPKTNQYGWGFVAVVDGQSIYCKSGAGRNPEYLPSRQIGGEIVAVLQALDYALYKKFKVIELCYDYEGIEKWVTEEWIAKSSIAIAYKYFFEMKNENIQVIFTKVSAHKGNYFNEMADGLAKKGANRNDKL